MQLEPFEKILREAIGLRPSSLGATALERAVQAAMARAGASSGEEYFAALEASAKGRGDPAVLEDLVREVVVPETWFFRDRAPFHCLRERLLALKRAGKKPRILSAPCATGEEAYSIAITCLEAGLRPGEFYLEGADVSPDALEAARRGRYGRHSFREDPGPLMRYFSPLEGNGPEEAFAVCPEAAGAVTFTKANIVSRDFLAGEKPFDVIFSRNFLIYLHSGARKRLMANLERLMAEDGLLFAGHSEIAFFMAEGFCSARYPGAFACRRSAPPGETAPRAAKPSLAARPAPSRPAPPTTAAFGSTIRPGAPGAFAATSAKPRSVLARASRAAPGTPPGKNGEEDGDLLERAKKLADLGSFSEAKSLCRSHLERDRRSAEAYYLLGLVDAAEQRPLEARTSFQKALYLDPAHAASLAHLALLHEQLGDAAKAELCRKRLRRLNTATGEAP